MVEHCHLQFTENPYQQYLKPPIKFNFEEAAIIDGEIQQLLDKGVLEETDPTYGQYVSAIFLRKKKNVTVHGKTYFSVYPLDGRNR